jgi:signal transduction histidine kinase
LSDRILVLDSRGIVTLASAAPKGADDVCGDEPALATGMHYRTTLASCFSDFSDVVFGVERILAGKGSEYRGVIPAGDGPEAPHAEVHAVRLGGPRFRAVLSWRLGESVAPDAGGKFRPERLQMAREEERRRMARELHDSLQQDLTAIDLGLQSLAGRFDDSAASDIVAELKLLVGRVHLDVRATTFLMHPPELADGGLPAALERMLNGLQRRSRLEVEYQSVAGKWKVPMRAAIALYRIAQEAMMNVYRHSRATHAVVRLFPASDHVVLDIEDNGIGFDPATAQGVGIRSMVSRAREQQGSLSIERLERGTLVRVKLPIGARRSATTAGR